MRTRKTIPMNGKAILILITRVAAFLWLTLLAAGISISAEIARANTPPWGGVDAATRTDAEARTDPNIADVAARAKARPVLEKFQQSPAVFIENQGQWEDASIRFAMNSMGANAGLTSEGVRFQLFQREAEKEIGPIGPIGPMGQIGTRQEADRSKTDRRNAARGEAERHAATKMKEFAIRFDGAREAVPEGDGKSEQVFHYRRGEQARWRENVPSWNAAVYRGLWEGVALRVTGQRTGVKYEFLVSPGADWRKIRLRYEGIESLKLREDGSLELNLGAGWKPLVDAAPYIYQDTASGRKQVAGRFSLTGDRVCAFEIMGAFDPALPLVIDPELAWSTYLGGDSSEQGFGIAVDDAGNVLVTGITESSGWVSGGLDTTYNGDMDAFVAKLSGNGEHLWSTYLGGSKWDWGCGIAVDGAGNVFVTGYAESGNWVSGGFDTTLSGSSDAFVVKLSGSGAHLWSTYLGGSTSEGGDEGITVNNAGDVFVTGSTSSSDWVSGGFDTTFNGYYDVFVVKLSGSGAHLWSTYLGGSGGDYCADITVDSAGNVFVTGYTESSGWVSGGFDTTYNGGSWDAFVVGLSGSGAHLWSTYLGGSGRDWSSDIAVDAAGNVFVTGDTDSSGWVSGGFDTSLDGGRDGFVAKLSGSGSHLWSTYLGGNNEDGGMGIAADGAGNVFVTGATGSSGWVSGGFDTTYNGGSDAFVVELSGNGVYLWSTYLGGSGDDAGSGIAVDGAGNAFVTGYTNSSGWVSGGFDTTHNGRNDAFVAKIAIMPDPPPPVTLEGPLPTLISDHSSAIEWRTDKPATSFVYYGTTTGLATLASVPGLAAQHRVELTGLTANTLYYYKAASSDAAGNGPTQSSVFSFTTLATPDLDPPDITEGPMALDVTDTGATVLWTTNEPATSGVSYNDGSAYGEVSDDNPVIQHSVRLTNLSPATLYHCTVSSKDAAGNGPTLSPEFTFTTQALPDTAPPVITEGPIVMSVSSRGGTARWITDESADSVVAYGLTPETLYQRVSQAAQVHQHNVSLTNLTTDTLYYYRVRSTDARGNGPTSSAVYPFRTDTVPDALAPVFLDGPRVLDVNQSSATIYWETDELSDTVVDYGEGLALNLRCSDSTKTRIHQITLTGLTGGQSYSFMASSTDMNGNTASSIESIEPGGGGISRLVSRSAGGLSFTTDLEPDVTPPHITEGPVVLAVTDTTAMVRWVTDEIGDTRVWYGPSAQGLSHFSGELMHKFEHVVILTGLTPSTPYVFQAGSVDTTQNGPELSLAIEFTTQAGPDQAPPVINLGPVAVVNADRAQAGISWSTNEPATSEIIYGTSPLELWYTASTEGYGVNHSITVTHLAAGIRYYGRVVSTDPSGNTTISGLLEFMLPVAPHTGCNPLVWGNY